MHIRLLTLCLILLCGCAGGVKKEQFMVENETVVDKETDLMWAATDNRDSLTWQEAVDYCSSYNGGGYQDWRMPTKAELQTLIKSQIENEGTIITLTSNLVWASETDDSKGALCNFKADRCSWMEQAVSISLRALPVRDTRAKTASTVPPAALPTLSPQSMEQRLQILDLLHDQQLITTDEYNHKKSAILDEL